MDDPPGSPSGLVATLVDMPFGVDVAWQAPSDADLNGYLLTRSLTAPAAGATGPQDGTVYNPGDSINGYGEVIALGTEVTFQDLAEGPGAGVMNYYAVWAVDQAGQYSTAPATGSIDVPIPPQAATIEIASPTTNPVVTVTKQPLYGKLTGTAAYDAVTGLTLSLGVENDAARIVFNQKAVIDAINDAALTATSDGTDMNGDVAAYYGPEAMDIAASKSRDFVLTGTGSVDPIVIDLHLASNPAGFSGVDYNRAALLIHDLSGAKDAGGHLFGGSTMFDTVGFQPGNGTLKDGVFSEDGRMYYAGIKNMPYVVTVDMTKLTAVAGTDLSTGLTGIGFTSNVVMSPDGKYLYTSVTTGGHQFDNAGANISMPVETKTREIELVKIDLATMTEAGRVKLFSDPAPVVDGNAHYPKAAGLAITPDGARAVAPIHGTGMIWIVDLQTMTLIDTDAVAAGVQGVDASSVTTTPNLTTVSPDGAKAYVGSNHGVDEIVVVDLATYKTSTILSSSTAGGNGYGWGSLVFGPNDGKLYITRCYNPSAQLTSISIFDPATQMHDDVLPTSFNGSGLQIRGSAFSPDGKWLYSFERQNDYVFVLDATTGAYLDTDGDPANGVTPFTSNNIDDGHAIGVTPF